MKALLSVDPGGPDSLVLEDIAAPVAGPGEIVVEVRACGINFPDALIIADRYQIKPPRPFAPGGEVAGIVASTGPGVVHFHPGDRVLAMSGWGGLAQAVKVPTSACSK